MREVWRQRSATANVRGVELSDRQPSQHARRFPNAHASTLIRLWAWRRELDEREYRTLLEILSRFSARELSRLDDARKLRRIA